MMRKSHSGFTLVEMIVVMVITGIIGGMVAIFIKAPVQGYVDSRRRAEMTDIADTALRRITRDIRTALPNSIRITVVGADTYLEFLPVSGSGRYRAGAALSGTQAGCGSLALDMLDFTAADTCFEVLGPMPTMVAGATPDKLVIYNRGPTVPATGADAYVADNTAAFVSNTAKTVAIGSKLFPFQSPGSRFQVINTPVTYVCAPVAGGVGGTLTRYWGYAITDPQPTAPGTLTSVNLGAQLASKVDTCSITYGAVGQRLALVTLQLTLTDSGESVTLYNAAHVSNVP